MTCAAYQTSACKGLGRLSLMTLCVAVNTPESKPLVLENCSECDVTYKLFYMANKEPSTRRRSAGGKVAVKVERVLRARSTITKAKQDTYRKLKRQGMV